MSVRLTRGLRPALLAAVVVASLATSAPPASAAVPTVTAQVLPIVQGLNAPLGDITIVERSVGQLTVGDVITIQLLDASSGSTLHLVSKPAAGGRELLGGRRRGGRRGDGRARLHPTGGHVLRLAGRGPGHDTGSQHDRHDNPHAPLHKGDIDIRARALERSGRDDVTVS